MYLDNKYTRIYYELINRAKSRNLNSKKEAILVLGYGERHHIIPKSISGDNSFANLVYLTPREHFICHLLLPKMLEGISKRKMSLALTNFTNRSRHGSTEIYKFGSRTYQIIKENAARYMSVIQKGRPHPHQLGKPQTEENKRATSDANSYPCISPDGTIYDSTKQAGIAEGVTGVAIRARIKNQVSGWKYVDSSTQHKTIMKKKPNKIRKGVAQSKEHIENRVNSRKNNNPDWVKDKELTSKRLSEGQYLRWGQR
jgi:hypothetical protein